MWEAVLTFVFFFILIGLAFGADKYNAIKQAKLKEGKEEDDKPVIEFEPVQIYRELINEKKGEASKDPQEVEKRKKMKEFLKQAFKTDQIENINLEDLKTAVNGEGLINRIKYRKQVGLVSGAKKKTVAKGEIFKQENAHAEHLDEKDKNDDFGFKCLHYSVSEASGSIQIMIMNKKNKEGRVFVKTIEETARAGKDFKHLEQTVVFKSGESSKFVTIEIIDDDNWEPDKDLIVQLFDADSMSELKGDDTKTTITIIDDDKPGHICFEETNVIKALATNEVAEIVIIRKNGSDGTVTVEYETVQLDSSEHTATPDVDYVP